ncbi:MAG: putative phosphoglycerate mutase [Parcubacteria group bacterium Gr01-1014_91]|nr:MAG: putative phosphoglycerate mutase [Parcubacteria group bacterium Gr01-1014_91]
MIIYAVRHGLTECNKRDILNGRIDESLAPEGVEQAKQVASVIPESVTRLYSSPLLRARQTAEIINEKRALPTSFHDELMEVHMGKVTGKSWKDLEFGETLKEKHRTVQYDYRPEGESVDEVKSRVLSFLSKINEIHDDNEVLIVTHGGIIRVLKLLESGLPSLSTNQIQNASLYAFDFKGVFDGTNTLRDTQLNDTNAKGKVR